MGFAIDLINFLVSGFRCQVSGFSAADGQKNEQSNRKCSFKRVWPPAKNGQSDRKRN